MSLAIKICDYHKHWSSTTACATTFLGACSDSNEDPWQQYCSSWKNYCSSHTGVRANCKKTCNLCDGDGGRNEITFMYITLYIYFNT